MSNTSRRGPRQLSDILSELFTVRGYGRLQAVSELETAWNRAVGEPDCQQTRLGEIRRGVVTVTVAHPTLLEELAAFRKPELLEALRACAPGSAIQDIRFRIGAIESAPGQRPGSSPAERPNAQKGANPWPRSDLHQSRRLNAQRRPPHRGHEEDGT